MQIHIKYVILFFSITLCISFSNAQVKEHNKLRALIGLGFNYPLNNGFIDGGEAKSLNFPTVNLGAQYMLKRHIGFRLDYGFNRLSNADDAPDFKINYSRVNTQFVYNPTDYLKFLPTRIQIFAHGGPGIAIVKPLGTLDANKQTYLNAIIGLDFQYYINDKIAFYTDIAYVHGFTSLEDYNPVLAGLGAFNGSLLNLTFGVSVALSGCQYCN